MRQLDLFSPDQETLRHGYRLIECLRLIEAIELFEGLGKMFEDLGDVVDDAVSMCRYWFEVEVEADGLAGLERAERLWAGVKFGRRGTSWIHLRRGVADHLIEDLAPLGFDVAAGGLCMGRLLAELDHFRQAEEWYIDALSARPEDAVLRRQYGDLLWRMDRPLDARISYQRVLLSCPGDFPIDELQDSRLADIVEQFGIEMAPVYGWIARVLPFPEAGWDLPESRALGILRLIEKAENSRSRTSHDQMIAYRKELMEKEPEVFSAYMARLT